MSHSILFAPLLTLLTTLAAAAQPLPPVKDLPKRGDTLPDPLIMLDGTPITTPDQWNTLRKPELRTLFQHYMYGYFPPPPQKIDFTLDLEDKSYFSGKATKKHITIRYSPTAPAINLLLILPNAKKPARVFLGINFCGNHTLLEDPTIPLPTVWMPDRCPGVVHNKATNRGRGNARSVWNVRMIIDSGYAFASFYHGDVDPDKPDFTDGIHPHFLKPGQTQRGPHEWGTLAAWAWGVHRAVDYFHQDKDIDTTRIALVGHSRNGKAALLAAAFDERIELVIPHQAGCGGTAPSRTKNPWAETVKIINGGRSHWFNDTFQLFNDDVDKLPFDQHCLFALCAPRPILLSNAQEDQQADPPGQFDMLLAADPVYKLLGSPGLAAKQGGRHADLYARVPPTGQLLDSPLGYFLRPGKHSMTLDDWKIFLAFADKHFGQNQK